MVNYEIKSQLAKLLATEDIIVENKNVETAQFDVHNRVLTLPSCLLYTSPSPRDGLLSRMPSSA